MLVASAVSPDGLGLELVLYPGAQPSSQRLGIDRLVPSRAYRISGSGADLCKGQVISADANGHLDLELVLEGRTEVSFSPVT